MIYIINGSIHRHDFLRSLVKLCKGCSFQSRLWLSAVATTRATTRVVGEALWWTCEEHDGPLVNLGAPLCRNLFKALYLKLCIGYCWYESINQQSINISFCPIGFLRKKNHACLAKCQFVVSFWRWVRTYIRIAAIRHTRIIMYAYTGRYVHKHHNHKHMYMYKYIFIYK